VIRTARWCRNPMAIRSREENVDGLNEGAALCPFDADGF
jgi:hypothetical protein